MEPIAQRGEGLSLTGAGTVLVLDSLHRAGVDQPSPIKSPSDALTTTLIRLG